MNLVPHALRFSTGLLLAGLCAGPIQAAPDAYSFSALAQPNLAQLHGLTPPAAAQLGHSCLRKPGAGISLTSREFVSLNPGEITHLTLDFAAVESAGQLHISLEPGQGLELLSESSGFEFDLSQNPSLSLPVQLRTSTAGNTVLNIFARITNRQGQTSSRAMALVVQAGNTSVAEGPQKGGSPMPTDMAAVIVMPAAEVIY